MKRVLFLLATVFLLASCDQVIFPEPQPHKVKAISKIPQDLQGVFMDEDGDTLYVYEQAFSYDSDELSGMENVGLSDTAVLKYYKDRYFFNKRIKIDDEYFWLSYILHLYGSGNKLDIYAMDPDDVVKLAKLQEITSKIRDVESSLTYYLFDPKKKDYKKIISDTIFSKMISFERIISVE